MGVGCVGVGCVGMGCVGMGCVGMGCVGVGCVGCVGMYIWSGYGVQRGCACVTVIPTLRQDTLYTDKCSSSDANNPQPDFN